MFNLICPEETSATIEYLWMDITHTIANLTDKNSSYWERKKK